MKKLNFIQLDPRTPKDQQPNYDLWVEVTIPEMRNDLDHHWEHSDKSAVCQQALEKGEEMLSALTWNEFTIATVRADNDSITAMAVLKSMSENKEINKDLVRAISILDTLWPKWLKEEMKDNLEMHKLTNTIWYISFDRNKSLEEKVELVQKVLEWSIDQDTVENYRNTKQKEKEEIEKASKIEEIIQWKLVFLESDHRWAIWLWYEYAATIIALNQNMNVMEKKDDKFVPTWEKYKKYTIAKNTEQTPTDIDTILKEISELEKWRGGRWTIIWSPQNVSSNLTPEQVINIIKKYVK